uniref:Uncharacterized protein n=1 Tax=uncultured prokaryote TaxID=198431 RepID=A0A0H5Q3N7_9ZZZZ|nr:hypothetical protein [uncultured prokaryote]
MGRPTLTPEEQQGLPQKYREAYDDNSLFGGDFYDGARWALRAFSSWYWGDFVGDAINEELFDPYDWDQAQQPWA